MPILKPIMLDSAVQPGKSAQLVGCVADYAMSILNPRVRLPNTPQLPAGFLIRRVMALPDTATAEFRITHVRPKTGLLWVYIRCHYVFGFGA